MIRNLLPTIIVIALIPLFFWTSCISEEKKLARQKADSLTQVQTMRLDSIRRAQDSTESKHENINIENPLKFQFGKSGNTATIKYIGEMEFTISAKYGDLLIEVSFDNPTYEEFDSAGFKVAEYLFFSDSIIGNHRVFDRDIFGNIIEYREYNRLGELNESVISKYMYPKHHILKEQTKYNRYKLISKSIYTEGSSHNLLEKKYDENSQIVEQTLYQYDDEWKILSNKTYTDDGLFLRHDDYKYDEFGDEIYHYHEFSTDNGKDYHKFLRKYDSNRNLIWYSSINLGNTIIGHPDRKVDREYYHRYNERKLVSETVLIDSRESQPVKLFYEYKYDDRNNWIEKLEYKKTIPVKVTKRQIIYY